MNRLNIFRDIRFIIIVSFIGIVSLVVSAWSEKVGAREIAYVTPKDPTHKEKLFTTKDIAKLKEKYPELDLSYSYESTQIIQSDNRECLIWLIQTNENYKKWNSLSLRQGNFLNNNPYNKQQIVLDNEVAFNLFGKVNLLEDKQPEKNNIKIEGQTYKVEGVTKQSLYDKYKYKNKNIKGKGYSLDNKEDIVLNGFVICNLDDEKLKNKEIINSALATLGRDKEEYMYISAKQYMEKLNAAMQFIRSSILVMLLICLWKQMIASGKAAYINLQDELKKEYLHKYIRNNAKIVLKQIIIIIAVGGISAFIGGRFIKELVEVCTPIKNTLVQMEEYPRSIQIICRSSQIGLIFCSIVEIFLIRKTLKIQG